MKKPTWSGLWGIDPNYPPNDVTLTYSDFLALMNGFGNDCVGEADDEVHTRLWSLLAEKDR